MRPYPLFLLFVPLCFFSFSSSQDGPAGNGYKVESVTINPSGKSLTGKLQLISSTSVYGPDIQNLNLLAR